MLEEGYETGLAEQFERFLTLSFPPDQALAELRADLRLASQLKGLDLSAESQVRERLRAHLAQKIQGVRLVKSRAQHLTAHPRLWLGVAMTVLVILFLSINAPAHAVLERLFGWMTAGQASPTPSLVLTLADNTPTYTTRTAFLPMRLPENDLVQSPTPGTLLTSPSHPVAIPTPGVRLLP
jgi:hypothetical protein